MKLVSFAAVSFAAGIEALAQSYSFTTLGAATAGSAEHSAYRVAWVTGVTIDGAGNLYVVEWGNPSIRKITPAGLATTFAGDPNVSGSADGQGSDARFSAIRETLAVAADEHGNVFVADTENAAIRKISPEGVVSTLAGFAGRRGSDDGRGSNARFNYPSGVAVDHHGNVFVADLGNHTIRMITPDGDVTTLAGMAGIFGSVDGVGRNARFLSPASVTVHGDGNVYVASYDDTVRKVSPSGLVTTLAGRAMTPGYADGVGGDARFHFSRNVHVDQTALGITVDRAGNLFVGDAANGLIRKITPEGRVTTLGGSEQLFWPAGMSLDSAGRLYIADSGNPGRLVRAAAPPSDLAITAAPQSPTVAPGDTVVFATSATATSEVMYQWFKDGVTLPGATEATLIVRAASAIDAGAYRCIVTDGTGFAVDAAATLKVISAVDPGRLVNISVRSNVGSGSPALIMGAMIDGPVANRIMPVLVRAVGPSLGRLGVAGYLADPELTLTLGDARLSFNDNWNGDPQIAARAEQVGAFHFSSPTSLDAAIGTALNPKNSYHFQISGKVGETGAVLCEFFDATSELARDSTAPRVVSVSVRQQVGVGADVLIVGFVITGQTAKTVLIRAIGPSLANFGVSGVLNDPSVQLFAGTTLLRENHDWGGDVQIADIGRSVGAFALANTSSKDAVLLATLMPGNYSLHVYGSDNQPGVALAELYEVP